MKTATMQLTKDELWAIHFSIISLGDLIQQGGITFAGDDAGVKKYGEAVVSLGAKMKEALETLKEIEG
jgi:hypothetical protein